MKLSPKQIEYINKEREILIRVIEAKKASKTIAGLGADQTKMEIIKLVIALHNLEVNGEKNDKGSV